MQGAHAGTASAAVQPVAHGAAPCCCHRCPAPRPSPPLVSHPHGLASTPRPRPPTAATQRRLLADNRGAPLAAASTSAPSAPAGLTDWLAARGAINGSPAVRVEPRDGALALVAARDLSKGEAAITVPDKAWLAPAVAANGRLGPALEGLEPWLQLALFLIAERASPGPDWGPYVASLPADPDTPLSWSGEQRALLSGTQCAATLEGYSAFFEARYAQLQAQQFAAHAGLFPADVFTYEAFVWAAATVRARVHPPLEGDKVALVPGADLVAHSAKPLGRWVLKGAGLFGGGQALAWVADAPVAAGSCLSMDYGADKVDNQLLVDYGALDARVDRPGFSLSLTLPESDKFFDDKADVLEGAGLAVSYPFTLRPDAPPPDELLGFVRLLNLAGADAFLLESIFRDEAWGHLLLPVSEENERAACNSMADGCRSALMAYPSTIDADLELLRSGSLAPGSREEAAVRIRLGEKEALDAVLRFFEERYEGVGRLEFYAERRLKRLGLLDDSGRTTYDSFFEDGIA